MKIKRPKKLQKNLINPDINQRKDEENVEHD